MTSSLHDVLMCEKAAFRITFPHSAAPFQWTPASARDVIYPSEHCGRALPIQYYHHDYHPLSGLDHCVAHRGHSGGSHPPHEALCLSLYLAFSRPWISRHAECPSILTRFWPPGLWNTAQRPGPHSSPVPAVRLDKAKAMPGCPERGQRHVKTRHVCSTKSTVACFVLAQPVVFSPPAHSQMPLREDVRQQCSCSCPYHRRRTSRGLRSYQLNTPCIRTDTGPRGRLSHAAGAQPLGFAPLVAPAGAVARLPGICSGYVFM